MAANFISLHSWCAVISEWNNTDDEEPRNKSAIVLATGSPYQNNEGPLQRDEVKATFNKEENNDNARKSPCRFLLLLHRRTPFVIFRTISTLLYSLPFLFSSLFSFCSPDRSPFCCLEAAASKIECRSRAALSFPCSLFSLFFSSLYSHFTGRVRDVRRETFRDISSTRNKVAKREVGIKEEKRNFIFNGFVTGNFWPNACPVTTRWIAATYNTLLRNVEEQRNDWSMKIREI